MSFERPSLKELIQRIDGDTKSRLTTAQLRESNSAVFSRVLAGASHELHGHIDWIAKQLFVDTCSAEFLDRWCSIYGIKRRQATKASGDVTFKRTSGTEIIPAGMQMQNAAGFVYETTEDSNSDGVAPVRSLITGADQNMEAGDTLSMSSPAEGVYGTVTCGEISGGVDAESDESLRQRLLFRMQEQPHGGAKADYVSWAMEVPCVTRAWCYPEEDGVGTVTVRFVCDNQEPITPTETETTAVYNHLQECRPVTAHVNVKAPTLKPVAVKIDSLSPDTSAVRTAVEAELRDLFTRESVPGSTIYLSHIRAAISSAIGEVDHTLVAPTENCVAGKDQLLCLGDVTWL